VSQWKQVPEAAEREWAQQAGEENLAGVVAKFRRWLILSLAGALREHGLIDRLKAQVPAGPESRLAHAMLLSGCLAWPKERRRHAWRVKDEELTPEVDAAWTAVTKLAEGWIRADKGTFDKIRVAMSDQVRSLLEPAASPQIELSIPKHEKLSKEERERKVRNCIAIHKERAAKAELSIQEIAEETGVSKTSVHHTNAWQALQDRLEAKGLSKRPRKKKAKAFTKEMDAGVENLELNQLIREQKADDEGSPIDQGHRGKTRVAKRI
jgi:predicted DNA-binding protein YlxM (UPF0122 family)